MVLLMVFAFVAGAGTALSPCVLPILPAVLSAGVTGGRLRPLGLVTGKVLSFTFATIALVYVIEALGLPNDITRKISIATLLGFGIVLLIPPVADRVEAFASRLAPGPARFRGDGFWSGMLVGISLGFVYAPCAGPILAGVITTSAAQDFTAARLGVAFSYAIGSAVVLYAMLLGGRRFADRLKPIRGQIQTAMGVVMIAVAGLIALDYDTRFQTAIASDLPSFLVNPTGDLETSGSVDDDLTGLRNPHGGPSFADEGLPSFTDKAPDADLALPNLGPAPDFTGNQSWFNTENGEALNLEGLRGRVVLIDFWTYTCINCIRTLPYVTAWDRDYRDDGLTVVGVHTPEFPFEKDAGNVSDAIAQNNIEYPVAQDNDYGTWNAWGNQYWPSKYLIDAEGNVRYAHFGEGDYEQTEAAIRTLLREAGDRDLGDGAAAAADTAAVDLTTPETYLGSLRANGWVNGEIRNGDRDFGTASRDLARDQFVYEGQWQIGSEGATAGDRAAIDLEFNAGKVFLVLGSPGRARDISLTLDGKPIPARLSGSDVKNGRVSVSAQDIYNLVDLPGGRAQTHRLRIEFEPGIAGYAFTFG